MLHGGIVCLSFLPSFYMTTSPTVSAVNMCSHILRNLVNVSKIKGKQANRKWNWRKELWGNARGRIVVFYGITRNETKKFSEAKRNDASCNVNCEQPQHMVCNHLQSTRHCSHPLQHIHHVVNSKGTFSHSKEKKREPASVCFSRLTENM